MHTIAAPSGSTCEKVYEDDCVHKGEELCDIMYEANCVQLNPASDCVTRQSRKTRPKYQTQYATTWACYNDSDTCFYETHIVLYDGCNIYGDDSEDSDSCSIETIVITSTEHFVSLPNRVPIQECKLVAKESCQLFPIKVCKDPNEEIDYLDSTTSQYE